MKSKFVILEKRDRVAWLTLNRPEVLNALDTPLLLALRAALEAIARDQEIDVVVLTGAGKAFCSGMDLKALGQPRKAGEPDALQVAVEVFDMLEALDRPVIGAINGYAITGGLELALACDLLVASENAVFGDTHARVGILPGGGDSQKLPRLVGLPRGKEMLFASRFVSAREAEAWGLVSRVVPAEKLQEAVAELAGKISANHQPTVRRLKALVNQGRRLDLGSALMLERLEFHRGLQARRPEEVEERRPKVLKMGRQEARKKGAR